MTAKQKADYIFNQYNKNCLQILVGMVNRYKRKLIIKSCTLMCIKEIQNMGMWVSKECQEKERFTPECTEEYWAEVEKELRKI